MSQNALYGVIMETGCKVACWWDEKRIEGKLVFGIWHFLTIYIIYQNTILIVNSYFIYILIYRNGK